MNTTFTKEALVAWIKEVIKAAKEDTSESISYFEGTINEPICLVAGWHKVFKDNKVADIFCMSPSKPGCIMSIKVVPNGAGSFDSTDPVISPNGSVDDTCFPLEWDDNPNFAADFFTQEWERITEEHKEEICTLLN